MLVISLEEFDTFSDLIDSFFRVPLSLPKSQQATEAYREGIAYALTSLLCKERSDYYRDKIDSKYARAVTIDDVLKILKPKIRDWTKGGNSELEDLIDSLAVNLKSLVFDPLIDEQVQIQREDKLRRGQIAKKDLTDKDQVFLRKYVSKQEEELARVRGLLDVQSD